MLIILQALFEFLSFLFLDIMGDCGEEETPGEGRSIGKQGEQGEQGEERRQGG